MSRAFLFENREDAGRRLACRLKSLGFDAPVVFGLPRGGLPIAVIVADALAAPLDLVLVRKLGVPAQPELAFGAVTDGQVPHMTLNQDIVDAARLTSKDIETIRDREVAEIERRRSLYFQGRARCNPQGRTVILVDDGLATGATASAAIEAICARGAARTVLAIPVAPYTVVSRLGEIADEVICLEMPIPFDSVGRWYRDFPQLDDQSVVDLLNRAPAVVPND